MKKKKKTKQTESSHTGKNKNKYIDIIKKKTNKQTNKAQIQDKNPRKPQKVKRAK